MKNLFFLMLLAASSLNSSAVDPEKTWFISGSEKVSMKRVNLGYANARILLPNGEKLKVPLSNLKSFAVDGKIFEKLPLYKNGKVSSKFAYMQLIKSRGDLSLFEYDQPDSESIVPFHCQKKALVYRGNELVAEVTQKNIQSISNFFQVRILTE